MERLLLEVDSFELTSDSEITAPTWFIRAAGAGRVEIKRTIKGTDTDSALFILP